MAVNTLTLARGDLILPADQWILNLLARIGDLILAAKFRHLKILRNPYHNSGIAVSDKRP